MQQEDIFFLCTRSVKQKESMSCTMSAKIERTLSFFSSSSSSPVKKAGTDLSVPGQTNQQELSFQYQVSQISRNCPFCTRSVKKTETDLFVPCQTKRPHFSFFFTRSVKTVHLPIPSGQLETRTGPLCIRSVSFKTAGTDINFCTRAVKAARISFFLSHQVSQHKNWSFPFVPDQPKQQELTFHTRSVKTKSDLFLLYQISQNGKNWPFTPGQLKQQKLIYFLVLQASKW